MLNVTGRISMIKQPRGGYLKPSAFQQVQFNDGISADEPENISPSVIGTVTDYLLRFVAGDEIRKAFCVPLAGAQTAQSYYGNGKTDYLSTAGSLAERINKSLDDDCIIAACKLVTFDGFARGLPSIAITPSEVINPDLITINHIRLFVQRGHVFLQEHGPVIETGFNFFSPEFIDREHHPESSIFDGGYTPTVMEGEGDFLTADTLWDIKVLKNGILPKHTLQILMYWIMGQYSRQSMYKGITKIGIFNPRHNIAYWMDVSTIPHETIEEVENNVICYE